MRRSISFSWFFTLIACGGFGGTGGTGNVDQSNLGSASFCSRIQAHSTALQEVLAACPGGGDENIYGFDRNSCDSKASTACSASEQAMLLTTRECDAKIAACAGPSDRSRVVQAISACAEGTRLSDECATAINP